MSEQTDFADSRATEKAFYAAFADCDARAMQGIWADQDVVCIHPGAPPVKGREAVLRSWTNILADADKPNLRIILLNRIERDGIAVHLVEEHIASPDNPVDTSVVLATNVYRRDPDGWRLLEHHASVPAMTEPRSLQ